MLTQVIKAASTQVTPVSHVINLDVCLSISNAQADATERAVSRMSNAGRQEFSKMLLETISATHDKDTKGSAEEHLINLFGAEILKHAVITQSRDGFFFSLTGEGTQFRAWYAPFGCVTSEHFDSCGTGCVFSAYCQNPEVLKEWIAPFVSHKLKWKSDFFGCVWIGHHIRR